MHPYIICHMVTSLDSKVTGEFLASPTCERAAEIYCELNRNYKADAFACGSTEDKPLFYRSTPENYILTETKQYDGCLWLRYKKEEQQ